MGIDLNQEQGISQLGKFNDVVFAPQILIFPAEHKKLSDAKKFYGKLMNREVAAWIWKNADIKFQFRDKLHMSYITDKSISDEDADDEMLQILYVNTPEEEEIDNLM